MSRYILAAVVFVTVAALFGWVIAAVLSFPPFLGTLVAVALYAVGLWFGALPPGKLTTDRDEPTRTWPQPEAFRTERAFAAATLENSNDQDPGSLPGGETRKRPVTGWLLALVAAVCLGGIAIGFILGRGWDGGDTADDAIREPEEAAPSPAQLAPSATASASPTPSATPTPSPSATPTVTATATLTPAPPTPTAQPTPTPTTTSVPTGPPEGWMTGQWLISDTVTFGPSTGETFTFTVSLTESGGSVSGSGNGLELSGTRSGNSVSLTFTRAGAGGQFAWTIQPDDSMSGTFEDEAAGNGGVSTARRTG